MIVLYEFEVDAVLIERALVVCFGEKASLVPVPSRHDDLYLRNTRFNDFHYNVYKTTSRFK